MLLCLAFYFLYIFRFNEFGFSFRVLQEFFGGCSTWRGINMLGDFITRCLLYVAPISTLLYVYHRSSNSLQLLADLFWLITLLAFRIGTGFSFFQICLLNFFVPGCFLVMPILHSSVTKPWRRTGSGSKNSDFGVNIGNNQTPFVMFHLV